MSSYCIRIIVLVAALLSGACSRGARPPVVASEPTVPSLGAPTSSFSVDVDALAPYAEALPPDERAEQVADWAVWATAVHEHASPSDLRDGLFDRPPLRHPELDDVTGYAFGQGRRLVLASGDVWLFVSADDPSPTVTAARMADEVRVEQAQLPAALRVYQYHSSLATGRIEVSRLPDLSRDRLYSAELGYLEQKVTTAHELGQWLSDGRDLAYLAVRDGAVVVGGRHLGSWPARSVTLEDVAALFVAQRDVKRWSEPLRKAAADYEAVKEAMEGLIEAVNRNVRSHNSGSATDCKAFDVAAQSLGALLDDAEAKKFTSCAALRPVDQVKAQKALVERLQGVTHAHVEALRKRADSVEPHPLQPGFSLDPSWDTPRMIANLELMRSNPGELVHRARAWSKAAGSDPSRLGATAGIAVAAALARVVPEDAEGRVRVPDAALQKRIGQLVDAARAAGPRAADIVEFSRLKADLASSTEKTAGFWSALLSYIEGDSRVQCARYDGPIDGTRAGMTLFYTDLVAKLWAGLDFADSAPLDAVPGFRTLPIEDEAATEDSELNTTRLWFGPRLDGFSAGPKGATLYFAPVATRVYAAGSSSLDPGKEATPGEVVGRVLGWWDRHFAEVAEYEPEYHRLNQITKWSVATALLVDRSLLTDLGDVRVEHELRFDAWLQGARGLRSGSGVTLLEKARWIGDRQERECLPLLQSRVNRRSFTFKGGVALGSSQTVDSLQPVSRTLRRGARRAGTTDAAGGLAAPTRGTRTTLADSADGATARTDLVDESRRSPDAVRARKLGVRVSEREGRTKVRLDVDERAPVELGFVRDGGNVRLTLDSAIAKPSAADPKVPRSPDSSGATPIRGPPPTVDQGLFDALGGMPATPSTRDAGVQFRRGGTEVVPAELQSQAVDPARLLTAAAGARRGGMTDIYVLTDEHLLRQPVDTRPQQALSHYRKLPGVHVDAYVLPRAGERQFIERGGRRYYRVYRAGHATDQRTVLLVDP